MIRLEKLAGSALLKSADDLARLRIAIFRDFPYLYAGNLEYEKKYLARYTRATNAAIIAARDTDQNDLIVGAATVLPLSEEDSAIKKPFIENKIPLKQVYYFGESLLNPAFRGLGLGHKFFDERETHALQDPDCHITAFCAVERESDHPDRPKGYRSLHAFWEKRGYVCQPHMKTELSWTDLGHTRESVKIMTFWIKEWK